jgi:DNA-binding protein H-NS
VKDIDLARMSVDELWTLHEQLREVLATRLDAEMHEMQRRMAEIDAKSRRPYPKVHPKYRNPERPSETWSGRGLQPHWVRAATQGKEVRRPADLPVTLSNARPDLSLRGAAIGRLYPGGACSVSGNARPGR